MSKGQTKGGSQLTTPQPTAPSERSAYTADHSFTLQAIMELHKCNGQLTEAMNGMKVAFEKIETKLNNQAQEISGITHKLYAATVVIIIFITVSGFIINKASDLMIAQMNSEQQAAQQPVLQQPPTLPSPEPAKP